MSEQSKTFTIKTFTDVMLVHSFLGQNHSKAACEGKPYVVHITQKQEDRSKAQNRLYWKWLQQWSKRQGTDKDSEHLFFKRKFLSVIYFRDDVKEYRNTFNAVKELKLQKHPLYDQVANGLNELITTTDASVSQFSEYLNEIHAFCNKHGCWLETPDDLMWVMEK